jgi:hypothetical protein
MNTGEVIILCANIPVLVAVSIVAYRERRLRQQLDEVGQYLELFSQATMGHIGDLRNKVFKEKNEYANH